MANGLRKLIRKARKETLGTTLLRKSQRFGSRLRVEELEERIAPATIVSLDTPGCFATWDDGGVNGDATFDTSDGIIGIGESTTTGVTVAVADITDATTDDTVSLNLSITADTAGAGARTISIISNKAIGNIDLSGLSSAATSVTLVIASGLNVADFIGGVSTNTIDGETVVLTIADQINLGTGDIPIVNGNDFATAGDLGMGNITLPSVSGTDIACEIHFVTEGTGAIGTITSADTDLNMSGATDNCLIDAGSVGAISWAGDIIPAGNAITFTIDNDAVATNLTSLSVGAVTLAGAGGFIVNAEGIGALTTGAVTISGAGGVAIDADATETNDGLASVTMGNITLSGAGGGDLTIDGGVGGITGLTQVGSITSTATNDSDILIAPSGAGGMAGFTATGLISTTGVIDGSITIGADGATAAGLGAVSLAGITNSSTDGGADISFLGQSIGNITSSAALTTAAGTILFDANGAAALGSIGDVTITGNVNSSGAGLIQFVANDDLGDIDVTGNVGSVAGGAISFVADNGGTALTGNVGTIDVTGTIGAASAVTFQGYNIGVTGGTNEPTSIGAGAVVTWSAENDIANINTSGVLGSGGNTAVILADSDTDGTTGGDIASVIAGGAAVVNIDGVDLTLLRSAGAISGDIDLTGDIGSIISGGAISATIDGDNIGTVQSGQGVADHISAAITATGDIDVVNAGAGDITAAVSAAAAESGSPLYTVIHNGNSYAVWAFQAGSTTTTVSGATANVVFNGAAAPPTFSVTALDTNGAAVDVYVTSRVSTGGEQVFTDPDAPLSAATSVELVALSAVATTDVGSVNLVVEGDFDTTNVTNVTVATMQVDGDLAGTLTGGDITIGGVAAGGLTITSNVGVLTVNGDITGALTIQGNATDIIVNGDVNAKIDVTGTLTDIVVNGDLAAEIEATAIAGGVDVTGDMTGAGIIDATAGNVGDVFVAGAILAGATITATEGYVTSVTAGGALNATITASSTTSTVAQYVTDFADTSTLVAGSIGAISSYGLLAGVITADGNIDSVSNGLDMNAAAAVTAAITADLGSIGSVSAVDGDITGAILATVGNINSVEISDYTVGGNSDVTSNITAGGDIDSVIGDDITGTIIASQGTTGSPITTFQIAGVDYIFAATGADGTTAANAIFNYTFLAGALTITAIDNWDGTAVRDASLNISLTTTTTDDAGNTVLDDAQFNLAGLDFDNDSIVGGGNVIGTLTVEGAATGINTGLAGTIDAVIVEGDLDPVLTSSIGAVAAGSANGVDDPTAAQLQALFVNPGGGAVTIADPAGTAAVAYTIPVSNASAGDDVSFAIGDGTSFSSGPDLEAGDTGVSEFILTANTDGSFTVAMSSAFGQGNGNVDVDGDLDYMLTAIDLGNVTVDGSILVGGGIWAFDVDNIVVGTAGDTTTGNMAGTITQSSAVAAGASDIGTIDILGDFSGTIQADGDVGVITLGQQILNVDGSVAQAVGGMTGTAQLIVGGDCGAITAELGIDGLIMIGGDGANITANGGALAADIFEGGGGAGGAITLEGVGITGQLALGAVAGNGGAVIMNVLSAVDADPVVYTLNAGGAPAMYEIAAGAVDTTNATVGQMTVFGATAAINATANGVATIDVDRLIDVEDGRWALTVEGDLGWLLVGEGATTARTSEAVQAEFNALGTTTFDVVAAPTVMDTALNDNDVFDAELTVAADNVTGGMVVNGDFSLAADVAGDIGHIVSLNGAIMDNALGFALAVEVDAATSIGSIVASKGIDGDFQAEGPIAIAAVDLDALISAEFGATLAAFVPAWFTGGVLSEVANITANFDAMGTGNDGAYVGGDAMGLVNAPVGNVTGVYNIAGNFEGILAPLGAVTVANIAANSIGMVIAPATNAAAAMDNVGLQVTNGEVVATSLNAVTVGDLTVTPGAGVVAIVDGTDVTAVGLGAAGTTLALAGDTVDDLLIFGNTWAGGITSNDVINTIMVGVLGDGAVAATATLVVDDFGTIEGDTSAIAVTQQLDRDNQLDTFTNMAGVDQTLYLKAGRRVTADWTTVFGKLSDVVINGRGSIDFASAVGALDEDDMRDILRAGTIGAGTAHVGDITLTDARAKLSDVVIQGNVGDVAAQLGQLKGINDMYVAGDAGDITAKSIKNLDIVGDVDSVQADKLSKVQIGGDAGNIAATKVSKLFVGDDVTSMKVGKASKIFVGGDTAELTASTRLVNSVFSGNVVDIQIFGAKVRNASANGYDIAQVDYEQRI